MALVKANAGRIGQFKKRLNTLSSSSDGAESKAARIVLRDWEDMSTEAKLIAQNAFENSYPPSDRTLKHRQGKADDTSTKFTAINSPAGSALDSANNQSVTPSTGETRTKRVNTPSSTEPTAKKKKLDNVGDEMLAKMLIGSSVLLEGGKQKITLTREDGYEFAFETDAPDAEKMRSIKEKLAEQFAIEPRNFRNGVFGSVFSGKDLELVDLKKSAVLFPTLLESNGVLRAKQAAGGRTQTGHNARVKGLRLLQKGVSDILKAAEEQKRSAQPKEKVPTTSALFESVMSAHDPTLTYSEWRGLSETLCAELLRTAEVIRVELSTPVVMIARALPILAQQQSLLIEGLIKAEKILNTPIAELTRKAQDKMMREAITIPDDDDERLHIKEEQEDNNPNSTTTFFKLGRGNLMEAEAHGCLSPARKRVLERALKSPSSTIIAVNSIKEQLEKDVERRREGKRRIQHSKTYAEQVAADLLEEVIHITKRDLGQRIKAAVARRFKKADEADDDEME